MATPDTKKRTNRLLSVFSDNFGFSRILSALLVIFILAVMGLAIFWFFYTSPPRTLTISSGPPGSTFARNAEKYRDILAKSGVKLKILASAGSLENLERLTNRQARVDFSFVQGGVADVASAQGLVSLGSVAYEPLLVFYRNPTPLKLLSELSGRRIAVGPVGSGTRALATTLLETNGIATGDGSGSTLSGLDADAAAQALLDGKVDAVFMTSDSASGQAMGKLLRAPGIRLLSFEQADAYTRRFNYLNKLCLPEGAIDLGKNLPANDVWLVGPTVELVARPNLNSAISDLLLETAQEVHGRATILQNQGEFPKPLEHEFKISPDATRYYKSGKTFLYRELPFWMASWANRILVVFVPTLLVVIPGVRLIPALYKWQIRLRIFRWYRSLMVLERDLSAKLTPAEINQVQKRLDEIEQGVRRLKVPASFADTFYGLRGHIDYVRERLAKKV